MEVSKQITWGIPFAPADRFSWFFFWAKQWKCRQSCQRWII